MVGGRVCVSKVGEQRMSLRVSGQVRSWARRGARDAFRGA